MSAKKNLRKLRGALSRCNADTARVAAENFARAIAVLPADSVLRQSWLQTLTDELFRIRKDGTDRQLDTAILACRSAAAVLDSDVTSQGRGLQARMWDDLSIVQTARYERTHAEADLNDLMDARRRAVDVVPADDPRRGLLLQMLSSGAWLKFQHLGMLADLDETVKVGRSAAEAGLGPDGLALLFSDLCRALRCRYELSGIPSDLSDAIDYGQQAVRNAGAGHSFRASCLVNYSNALLQRFELLGRAQDLENGRTTAEQAVECAIEPTHLAGAVHASAVAMRLQAESTGSVAVIEAAVIAARRAANSGLIGGDQAECLSNLASCLLRRFELASDQDDLDSAIDLGRQAVAMTAGSNQSRHQSNYGSFLLRRYQLVGELADLSAGIVACQAAADAALPGAPLRARYLGNLGNALAARFQQTGTEHDLYRAVRTARAALQASPKNDANRGSYLNGLAGALLLRPEAVSGEELAEAVELNRQAVESVPAGSASQAVFIAGRAQIMMTSFAHTHRPSELDQAVKAAQQAVGLTPAGHQFRALFLARLVTSLLARAQLKRNTHDQAGAASDHNAAALAGREAAEITTAPPVLRAVGAAGWGDAAAAERDWAEAVRAYQAAVELAAKAAPRALARADQEYQLTQLRGLGSRAAACCLELDRNDLAVQLLEQGRGVLLGQALDARTDLTALRTLRPQLATRFVNLRDQLAAADTSAQRLEDRVAEGQAAQASRAAEVRRQIAGEFEAVIAEARQLPGMARFLLPPQVIDLLPTWEHETVAVITVDERRSDALLLRAAGVQVIPLPGLSPKAVADRTLDFMSALDQTLAAEDGDEAAEAELTAVLGWLWETVAKPVLDALGITGEPGDVQPWPRIWWCPSGLLSFLPLHAAGYHDVPAADRRDTVLDRVVSSYTATVRALTYVQRPAAAVAAPAGQVLVVAMEHTQDAEDLPAAAKEADLLAEEFGPRAKVLDDANEASLATSESVLKAMPDYPWAHFACHAKVNLRDASASHLQLHDRDALTVFDVNRLRLEGAELAFLSACSTAMAGGTLPDEAINLGSAFQLAGYRRVVATLWPVDDDVAWCLARSFYASLAAAGTAEAAALALHHAIRLGRDRYADRPSMWATHVHSGI
jgi:tetratricopeptide (TPR) repeat protein